MIGLHILNSLNFNHTKTSLLKIIEDLFLLNQPHIIELG
jgi:hypothetical protein